jgi:hypothetical protein
MQRHTFKEHEFREGEKRWLELAARSPELEPWQLKARHLGELPHGFSSQLIDPRLYSARRLTPIGLWHIDSQHWLFAAITSTVGVIRDLVIREPAWTTVTAAHVAQQISRTEAEVSQVFSTLGEFGGFFSSSYSPGSDPRNISHIEVRDEQVIDSYLYFTSVEDVLERFYVQRDPRNRATHGYSYADLSAVQADVYAAWAPNDQQRVVNKDRAFVLMAIDPSKPEIEDVYAAIKEVCRQFKITANRADEIEHQGRITDRILEEISGCEFLIADLTYERPNVYYEIGYAHARGLKPILYRRAETRLHFDLSVHNVPEYKNVTELRKLLTKRLEAMTGRLLASSQPANS